MATDISLRTCTTLIDLVRDPLNGTAYRNFALKYGPLLYQYCGKFGLQPADADDICQKIFLEIPKKMKTYDRSRGRFRNWLYGVVYHEMLTLIREQDRAGQRNGDSVIAACTDQRVCDEFKANWNRVDDLDSLSVALTIVASRTSTRDWKIFENRTFDEIPVADVATKYQMTEAAVIMVTYRMRKAIKLEIERLERFDREEI